MKKIICIALVLCFLCGCEEKKTEVVPKPSFSITKDKTGVEVVDFMSYQVPRELGEPEFLYTQVAEMNITEAYEKINTLIDTTSFVYANYDVYSSSDRLIHKICDMIGDYYDDVGLISVYFGDDYLNFMYIYQNNKYYLIDYYDLIFKNSNHRWFGKFADYNCVSSSRDDIVDIFKDYYDNVTNVVFTSLAFRYIVDDNGNEYKVLKRLGEDIFVYEDYQVPYNLGLPVLTSDEINELVKSTNKEDVADRITTLADAIAYLKYSKFAQDFRNINYMCDQYNVNDMGNIYTNDTVYTASGLESLYINRGQCSSMSTLLCYLLQNDYPEIGYVKLAYTNNDGHAMIYIKGNDNRYYLINPASYVIPYDESKDTLLYANTDTTWLSSYTEEKGCCDTLEELMNELTNSNAPGARGVKINTLYTFSYNGIFCMKGNDLNSSGITIIFPIGSNPVCWTNNANVLEGEVDCNTSQTSIIGIKDLDIYKK